MEQLHQDLLALLRQSLHGTKAGCAQLSPELASLAQSHKVLPLIYEAAPDPALRSAVLRQIMEQTIKTSEFLNLYRQLCSVGLRPLVVKGIAVRSLYPKPDLRPSADEDLWILPENFDACHRAMLAWDMTAPADTDAYEIPYRKPESPLYIELHKHLFPPQSEAYGDLNRFFSGSFDRAEEISVDGTAVYTLCPTDHLFYLICHAFKHFLHSGFGIRQVCDIAIFAERKAQEIDWPQITENCKAIRADRFAAAIFMIGEKHLGISAPETFRFPDVDEEPLLNDLLDSGVYGSSTADRQHSSTVTLHAVSGKKRGRLSASLFPSAKQLEGRYPYLKKHPWLLPAAWCSRIFSYSREKSSPTQALQIGQRRVELLRQYGIIDKT